MRVGHVALLGSLVALLAAPPSEPRAAAGAEPAANTEAGESLYRLLECAGCHESAARPGMVVRPLSGLSARFEVESLAAYLAAPNPPMPPLSLTEAQRRELARYVLGRFP